MKVYYEESYGKYYDIDTNNMTEAEETLTYLIGEGKENGPEECVGSLNIAIIGNGDDQYQIMDAKIDNLSEHEKKFYLWSLIRWYQGELEKEIPETPAETKAEYAYKVMLKNLVNAAKEMEDLLCDDLW